MRKWNTILKSATALALLAMVSTPFAQRAASPTSPVANPPQFIIIGSDDNTSPEAMRWMADVISGGKNHNGTDRYMTFYVNTRNSDVAAYDWETNEELVAAALHAYNLGHSIGNHTDTHIRCVSPASRMSDDAIFADIKAASDKMIAAGIPKEHQFGFRTPFLAYSDSTYTAMNRVGFMYDASMNAAGAPGAANFPYTLDAGTGVMAPDARGNIAPDNRGWWGANDPAYHPGGNPIREHKGLWTIPISQVQIDLADQAAIRASFPPDCFTTEPNCYPSYILGPEDWAVGLVGGLDYNMWMEAKLDSGQTVRALMHTLRTTLAGNRAPISLGFHSQYYVGGTNYGMTEQQRKGLFEEFVKQASQLDNVFFVTGDMVIRWMQSPVPAAQFNPANYRRAEINCTNHIYNWVTITPATCLAPGLERERCNCGHTRNERPIPQLTGQQCEVTGIVDLISYEYTTWSFYTDKDEGFPASESQVTVQSMKPTLRATLKLENSYDVQWGTIQELPPEGKTDWPWLGLGTYHTDESGTNLLDMTKLKTVEITYTSNLPISISIPLKCPRREGSGVVEVEYGATLTAAPSGRTVVLQLSNFIRPQWAPAALASTGPANLGLTGDYSASDLVASFTFFHENYGQTVNLEVTSLKIDGQGGGTAIKDGRRAAAKTSNALAITGISAGKLNLSVPTAGNYTVAIYSVDGRMLAQTKTNLVQGVNSLAIGQNLAKGVAIVRVQGANTQLVRKITIR